MIKLLGLLIVAVGFALRLNALAVVVAAGIATGLLAGLSFEEILAMTGRFFVENRHLTLPILMMLPAVGLLEKHGLRQRVAQLMRQLAAATATVAVLRAAGPAPPPGHPPHPARRWTPPPAPRQRSDPAL